MKKSLTLLLLVWSASLLAQNDTTTADLPAFSTFSTTRVVNGHSFESQPANTMDVRITHRFGDIGGDNGGIHALWGIDNSSDIRIGMDYGITDDLMVGAGRSKGAGPWREIYGGFAQYVVLRQTKERGMPLSMAVLGSGIVTGMRASNDSTDVTHFTEAAHRLAYCGQLLIARRFGERLSIQLTPTYTHRNLVASDDVNDLFTLGSALRFKLNKVLAINLEYFYNFDNDRTVNGAEVFDAMGASIELDIGGHIFTLDVVNSGGIGENQFIPYTLSDIGEGEVRIGFTISRPFKF